MLSPYQKAFARELKLFLQRNGGRATPEQIAQVRAIARAIYAASAPPAPPKRRPPLERPVDARPPRPATGNKGNKGNAKTVRWVKRRYPEAYARVRAACQWAADSIDLDDHAAMIVLTTETAKASKGSRA